MKKISFVLVSNTRSVLLLVYLLTSVLASAQEVLETNPPSVHWQQVNTPSFRVIFPEGFEVQGQRVASLLERIKLAETRTLKSQPRKISIILQNQSSVSNGFVTLFPRRSEFYAMPSQDYNFLGTNDWLNLLAVHEYRHVVQYQHAKRGFNKLLYYILGPATMAGLAHAAAPSWFWEGDAVATETALTPSGRGKIPNFSLVFKTNLLEGRSFNYHKQYLRSYKHHIPDHYVLGFHMVSYLRKQTNDPEIWSKITARSWSVPFIPFAFSNAIKNKADLYVTQLYREMANDLRRQWIKQIDSLEFSDFENLPVKRSGYTDYTYPQELADGSIVAIRFGIADIPEFVDVGNRERRIFTPGFINDTGMLSASGSVIVWNEFGYDPRWLVRNYSLIKAYDLRSGKVNIVGGKKSRYTSAAISPASDKIVAARTGTDYKTTLIILSYPEGRILAELPNAENHFYSMARWGNDNRIIVALKTSAAGKSIVLIDSETLVEKQVTETSQENVGYPVLFNDYVLYSSPATGIDNIFALNLSENKTYQVTTSKYGAYNPMVTKDGQHLYYNDQTRDGLDVVMKPFDPTQWNLFQPVKNPDQLYAHLVESEDHAVMSEVSSSAELPVTRYRKVTGVVNPYNWGFYVNNDLTEGNIGLSSQDLLSTVKIDAGYSFNINEQTSTWEASVSYQGLFPIIDVSASVGNRSLSRSAADDVYYFTWREQSVFAGIRIPLLLTSSKFSTHISLESKLGFTRTSDYQSTPTGVRFIDLAGNGNLISNNFNLTAYRLLKRARRDINSKWGQYLVASHRITPSKDLAPFNSDYQGEIASVVGYLYFPGILKHHSFWGYGAYQKSFMNSNTDLYLFPGEVPQPRGLIVNRFENFTSGSLNYTLPVWYPDIALGPIVNFQRVRANVFTDYGYGTTNLQQNTQRSIYNSAGLEVKVDFNFMRFLPQIDMGVRYSVDLNTSQASFEVLVGTINL